MDCKSKTRIVAINILLFVLLYFAVSFNKDYLRPMFGHTPFLGVVTGSVPNFLAAYLISLMLVNGVVAKRPKYERPIVYAGSLFVFTILTAEELRPMWGASTYFDWFDVVASGLGSLLAISTFELIASKKRSSSG